MKGKELISTLTESIDLPKHLIENELESLLASENLSEANITLDQLRELLASYLQDVLSSTKQAVS